MDIRVNDSFVLAKVNRYFLNKIDLISSTVYNLSEHKKIHITSRVGNRIRKIRELKNLKQEYMAEQLGISVNAYGNMERGEANVSMERPEQIAKAFEVNVQDILSFDEKCSLVL